jgi:chaperone modulatory protein CbpM
MLVVVHGELRTLETLAQRAGMHPTKVRRCVDLGLIQPDAQEGALLYFDPSILPRLRKIERLHESLGINFAGIAVILDLLDRIRVLQRQNRRPSEGHRSEPTNALRSLHPFG